MRSRPELMNAEITKTCLVAVDTPGGPRLCSVQLAMTDTLDVALQQARAQLDSAGSGGPESGCERRA